MVHDGRTALEAAREQQPEDRRRSREAGIQYHFVKPVEPLVMRNLLAGATLPAGWESDRPF